MEPVDTTVLMLGVRKTEEAIISTTVDRSSAILIDQSKPISVRSFFFRDRKKLLK